MTGNLKQYMGEESAMFNNLENNPLIYSLIIPKIVNHGSEHAKNCSVLKNAVDLAENFTRDLPTGTIKLLKENFKPGTMLDLFKISNDPKHVFETYLLEFKSIICNNESNFTKSLIIDKKVENLYNSPEYKKFIESL